MTNMEMVETLKLVFLLHPSQTKPTPRSLCEPASIREEADVATA